MADGFYHSFRNDTAIMKQLGVKHMRLSIAWPRILPQGTGEVNQAGLAFYNRVVDALLEAGIEPHVTLYHWDLPQVRPLYNLATALHGFMSPCVGAPRDAVLLGPTAGAAAALLATALKIYRRLAWEGPPRFWHLG